MKPGAIHPLAFTDKSPRTPRRENDGASFPALIQQMLQPEFYPHPVSEVIKLVQTHIFMCC
jgi:hypothetical protein